MGFIKGLLLLGVGVGYAVMSVISGRDRTWKRHNPDLRNPELDGAVHDDLRFPSFERDPNFFELSETNRKKLLRYEAVHVAMHRLLIKSKLEKSVKIGLVKKVVEMQRALVGGLAAIERYFSNREILYERSTGLLHRTYGTAIDRLARRLRVAATSPWAFKKLLRDVYCELTEHTEWITDTTVQVLRMEDERSKQSAAKLEQRRDNLDAILEKIALNIDAESEKPE